MGIRCAVRAVAQCRFTRRCVSCPGAAAEGEVHVKGLILAGGSAVRFRPFSYSMPKQLIPIANKPVLEYVIGDLADLGVTEVGVVVGDWAPQIAESIGDGSRFGVRIS